MAKHSHVYYVITYSLQNTIELAKQRCRSVPKIRDYWLFQYYDIEELEFSVNMFHIKIFQSNAYDRNNIRIQINDEIFTKA